MLLWRLNQERLEDMSTEADVQVPRCIQLKSAKCRIVKTLLKNIIGTDHNATVQQSIKKSNYFDQMKGSFCQSTGDDDIAC